MAAETAQQLLEAVTPLLGSLAEVAADAREDFVRALLAGPAREVGASRRDVDTVVETVLAGVTEEEVPSEAQAEARRIVETLRSRHTPRLTELRAREEIAEISPDAGPEVVEAAIALMQSRGRLVDTGGLAKQGEEPRPPFGQPMAVPPRTVVAVPNEAAQRRRRPGFLAALAQDSDGVASRIAQARQEALAMLLGESRRSGIGFRAFSPSGQVTFSPDRNMVIDPTTGQPVMSPDPVQARDASGAPISGQYTFQPQTLAPIGGLPPDDPSGLGIIRRDVTRENLGGRGSADTLERRAEASTIAYDAYGNILAEDGQPLIDPDGRIRTDRDGMPLRPLRGSQITTTQIYNETHLQAPVREQWGMQRIQQLQTRLANTGLLDGREITWGFYDAETRRAFEELMGYANLSGISWGEAASELQFGYQAGLAQRLRQEREDFEGGLEPYRPPDPALLRTTVRDAIREYLDGHDASAEDMMRLADEMGADFRADYDAETARARAVFERELLLENDPRYSIPTEMGGLAPPPMPQMPAAGLTPEEHAARLQESVETEFAPQRNLLDETSSNLEQQQSIFAGVNQILTRRRGP